MTNDNIRKLGIGVLAVSALAALVKAGEGTIPRCCGDPATCVCEMKRNMMVNILEGVKSIPT
jgi:hypothetical protein